MEHLSNVMLIDSQRQNLEREARLARRGEALPARPVAWRAYLVMAIVIIGLIAWWII